LLLLGLLACTALVILYPPLMLLLPGGYCFLASFLLERMFPKYVSYTDNRQTNTPQL
jgi:hypothetical protein